MYLHTRALSEQHSDPCALSALEPFFGDLSAARPRFVVRLARSDSPQSRGPCPRADPPSPRPSRSATEVARSRLRGLPHAPQSQPCLDSPVSRIRGLPHAPQSQPRFFTTPSLSGSSYSPAVTLFFFLSLSGSRPSWSRCCCCCCLLLLLPATSVLKLREMLGTSIAAVLFLAASISVL